MIKSGKNLVRVSRIRPFTDSIYQVYQFTLQSPTKDEYTLVYRVPFGSKPHEIITALSFFHKINRWFLVELEEKSSSLGAFLSIKAFKDPSLPQDEIWDIVNAVRGTGTYDSSKIPEKEIRIQ